MPNPKEIIKISASHRNEIQATDLTQLETLREKTMQQALLKANASAEKVAKSLEMRLLGIEHLSKSIQETDAPAGSKTIEAVVHIEYRVSGFNQTKIDFKIIRNTPNLHAFFKKEFSARWFSFKLWANAYFQPKHNLSIAQPTSKRALVVGHFSLPGGGGTFGDIEAQELVCEWLSQAQIEFDVASNIEDGVRGVKLEEIDSQKYGIFIFVCGPWYPQKKKHALLLKKFEHCLKIGVNLTIHEAENSGFDYLLSRDNPTETNTDISFAKKVNLLPVAGILLVERQAAYGKRQRHLYVKQIIQEYLQMSEVAPLWLDTIAHNNLVGIQNSQQFESIIRKADIVITNRLHGVVLSLKNAVPVIAIDAVAGGGKVTSQAKALGWPMLISAESLTVEKLGESVKACLNMNTASLIEQTQQQAFSSIEHTKTQFFNILESVKGV